MKRRSALPISILILLSTVASSQSVKPDPSKVYWLKYNLIFLKGCQPRVFPHNIIFSEGDCSSDAWTCPNLLKGTKVEIKAINKGQEFAKVSFTHEGSDYEALLQNDSARHFDKSFNLLFSAKEVIDDDTCTDHLKTKRQVIKCLGFPISIREGEDFEIYEYNKKYFGFPFMYDDVYIEIKRGKVIGIGGTI